MRFQDHFTASWTCPWASLSMNSSHLIIWWRGTVERVHTEITQSHRADTFNLNTIQISSAKTQQWASSSITALSCITSTRPYLWTQANMCFTQPPLSVFDLCLAAICLLLEYACTHTHTQTHTHTLTHTHTHPWLSMTFTLFLTILQQLTKNSVTANKMPKKM